MRGPSTRAYMEKIKIYTDSKEFPLENFERIESTGNYFYMIKGYDAGDDVSVTSEEMEAKYKDLVQEYVVSLNSKNFDIVNTAKLTQKKVDTNILIILYNAVVTKINRNNLALELGKEIDNSDIFKLLSEIQIKKSDDLNEVLNFIKNRIERLENDISEIEAKLEKSNDTQDEKTDINIIITNVEQVLERSINMKEVTLYRFGIMQEMSKRKIDQINKMQQK